MSKPKKTCLVITYGPVPTEQYKTVEGGGMRAWGIATGLRDNGYEVSVAVNQSFPQKQSNHENINLTNWTLDGHFIDLINSYDMVIMSYCMGDSSQFVARHLSTNVCLVLDLYVPIYVEISARDSKDIEREYLNYEDDMARFNEVLRRGDYFICANEAQKTYYLGVFSALNIINPLTYRQDRLFIVPFGIHRDPPISTKNPYLELGIREDDFVVLWFGGLYPWFKIQNLLDAIKELSKKDKRFKFVIVGGKNPFNGHPDFTEQYDKTVRFAKKHMLTDNSLFFVDWVDFHERANWYEHANAVISINNTGEENSLSWRTRVMDYVWGGVAILTNGGDPLSETLINEQAAVRLFDTSANALSDAFKSLMHDQKLLDKTRKNIRQLQQNYFWDIVVKPLLNISSKEHPYSDNQKKVQSFVRHNPVAHPTKLRRAVNKAKATASLPRKVYSYTRENGIDRLIYLVDHRLKRRPLADKPRFVFISHPIDHTGAPQIMLQVVYELAEIVDPKRIIIVAPHSDAHLLRKLREKGIRILQSNANTSNEEIAFQLELRSNDFVMMNTVAIYENYRDFILDQLSSGNLQHAYWYIHEDEAQLHVVNSILNVKLDFKRIGKLVNAHKLNVMVPCERVRKEYNNILKTNEVRTVLYNIGVDKKYHIKRKAKDFDELNFLLQGTPGDGRKGHFIVIAAFDLFMRKYYSKNPEKYRNFQLTLVSIVDDYASKQIKSVAKTMLGNHVKIYGSMPKEEVLEIYTKCNAVICASYSETFALYVAEVMYMGGLILRNDSAGSDEQLRNGKNGFRIDEKDPKQIADVIERLLNKATTSNDTLLAMGQCSQEIISPYSGHRYLPQITQRTTVREQDLLR